MKKCLWRKEFLTDPDTATIYIANLPQTKVNWPSLPLPAWYVSCGGIVFSLNWRMIGRNWNLFQSLLWAEIRRGVLFCWQSHKIAVFVSPRLFVVIVSPPPPPPPLSPSCMLHLLFFLGAERRQRRYRGKSNRQPKGFCRATHN